MFVKCDWCGKEFDRFPSEIHYKRNFCSVRCNNKWQRKNALRGESSPLWSRKKVSCGYCEREFWKEKGRIKRARLNFCSRKCVGMWMSKHQRGENNPMYGRTHSLETKRKMSKTWFKAGNIPYNRIQFNEDVFWDLTQESAYLLGLIASDGHVGDKEFRISLCDRELVEKVRNSLFPEHHISEVQSNYPNHRNQHMLIVGSKRVVRRLLELKIKSQIPLIPDDLFSHYVRGFFDGDGSICVYRGALIVNFYGNKEFLGKLESELRKRHGFKRRTVVKGKGEGWRIGYGGSLLPLKLCKWMYTDARIYLERKHKVFINYFAGWSNNRRWKPWIENEISLLKERYPCTNTRELSRRLGRTYASVRARASLLNVKKEVRL